MKNIFENENGSITLFVLISMLFLTMFLVTIYTLSTNNEIAQREATRKIKEIYEVGVNDIESVYEKVKENASNMINLDGEGTEKSPYLIYNIDDLNYLAGLVNSGMKFTGEYFSLENNIEINGTCEYIPIGNSEENYFDGIFDGNSYGTTGTSGVLENKNPSETDVETYVGLFGYTGVNSIIKNINITYIEITGEYCGVFVGYNKGTVENCSVVGGICRGSSYTGGIVGYNEGTVQNCSVSVSTNSQLDLYGSTTVDIGGITGYNKGEIIGCIVENIRGITNEKYIGAFAGYNEGDIVECTNNSIYADVGKINLDGEGTEKSPYLIYNIDDLNYLAGLVNSGMKFTGEYFSLENNIEINGSCEYIPIGNSEENYFDGIFDGNSYGTTGTSGVLENKNRSETYVGLFGYTGVNSIIKNINITFIDITGEYCGVFVGYNKGILENCSVVGGVCSGSSYTGGIVGYNEGIIRYCSVSVSTNSQLDLHGSTTVDIGGITGYNKGEIISCIVENISVQTNGKNIGAFAGDNEGDITECTNNSIYPDVGN